MALLKPPNNSRIIIGNKQYDFDNWYIPALEPEYDIFAWDEPIGLNKIGEILFSGSYEFSYPKLRYYQWIYRRSILNPNYKRYKERIN